MVRQAGGKLAHFTSFDTVIPTPFAGAAIVLCPQRDASFNVAVQSATTKFKGCLQDASHPFHPRYPCANGEPSNPEDRAVLDHVASDSPYGLAACKGSARIQRVFHGITSLKALTGILSGGFAKLHTLDSGWYGVGMYFSPELSYAWTYARGMGSGQRDEEDKKLLRDLGLDPERRYKVVLVCDVVYGNPFPCHDAKQFLGKPLVSRHDAHVAVVDRSNNCKPRPSKEWQAHSDTLASEIVIDQASNILVRGVLFFLD